MDGSLIVYNSHDEYFKHPFGAVKCNEKIMLRLRVNKSIIPESIHLRLWFDEGKEEEKQMELIENTGLEWVYSIEFVSPETPGLIWYYFIIKLKDGCIYYGNNPKRLGGIGAVYNYPPDSYQITVYKGSTCSTAWLSESIMYQIFVDRFYNGREEENSMIPRVGAFLRENWEDNPEYIKDSAGGVIQYDFFGGNLSGIIKKLHYLRELNIGVIYLNPVFESPSNHKYDTSDYKTIDRMFGSNQTFKVLVDEAASLGIKIILDGVFSHTGSDSIYFNRFGNYNSLGAYQSVKSPYYSWYNFRKHPDEYECWWGIGTLPNVNELNESYENYIIFDRDSVIKGWMKLGVKGWRLDVADELPDKFIKDIKNEMRNMDSESILIGEVWEDASNKLSYGKRREYLLGEELDSVMNYPFRDIMLDYILGRQSSFDAVERLMQLYENYPKISFYSNMNLVGSHDVPRILTLLGEAPDENSLPEGEKKAFRLSQDKRILAIKRLKILVLIQMTFPGIPCIYYGDEAGVEGYRDPLNRRTYPWGKENTELLDWYRLITALRNKYDVLKTGTWQPAAPMEDVFGYTREIICRDVFNRELESNRALVLINRNQSNIANISMYIDGGNIYKMYDVLDNNREYEVVDGRLHIDIKPLGSILLLLNP